MAAPTFDEYAARAQAKYPGIGEAQIREAYEAKYSRTPVRTQGPGRDEFAARARAKYPDIGDDQIDEAYEAKYGAGFGTETKRTLASQVVAPLAQGTGAILGGLDRAFGDVPGTGLFDRAGEALFNYGEEVRRQNAPSADVASRSMWNPYRMGQNVIGGLGQVGTMVATGGAGIVPLVAADAGSLATELEAEGKSAEEARARATGYALASSALERVGLGRLLPTRLPGRIRAGVQEGATEVAQGVARNVAGDNPALENIGDTIAGEGIPAGIAAAILAPSGRRARGQAEDFAKQAGLDEGVAQGVTQVAPDRAGPEPLRDLEAQVQEVGKTRRGVYVSPANRGFTPPNLVELETPDGGALLVQEQDMEAAQAELATATDEATRQAVIGKWTGAGAGKPLDPNAKVVQAIRKGAVIRETVVPEAEAEATAKRMGAELKVPTRVVTAQEALGRRQRIIENEDQSPFKALGEDELLRRTDPEEARRQLEARVRARPIPARSEIPTEVGRLFETPEGSALVPVEELTPTKERRTSSGALKFMAATAKGEAPKRAPLKVRVDGTGRMLVEDGNGTLGASRFMKLPAVPADIELATTTPKGKEYERRLAPEARVELARLARDAEAFLPQFRDTLEGIAERITGTRVSNLTTAGALVPKIKANGSKAWDRVAEKVVAEDGGDWRGLKDMARATILVENKAQAEQALAAVLEAFGQAPGTKLRRSLLDAGSFADVVASDPYGYGDIKVNVNGPNGRVYEVQITTPGLFTAKDKGPGHKLYEQGREREGKVRDSLRKIVGKRLNTSNPDAVLEAVDKAVKLFRSRDPEMQRLFTLSRAAYGQSWERFFASSAQSARQAASEIGSPSALTDEGVTGLNTPESSALNATSPDTTAGLPSTSKNSLSDIPASSINGGSVATSIAPHKIAAPSGRIIEARPVFVELDALVTSDSEAYPAQFQPRERGKRAGLTAQVQKIARELTPWLLGVSNSTGSGAPIVGPGNLVESGNGRTLALRLAREQHPENFAAYQTWVREEADRLGADVSGMVNPVLIQERLTPLDGQELVDFTIDANRDEKAQMSPTELARADSTVLDPTMLTLLRSGDLSQVQNQDFMREFIARIPNAQGLVDAKGNANAQAIERAEAAVVAKAYGADRAEVSELLDRLYETSDEGVRRVTNAMKLASFRWAELRLALENGIVTPDYDLSGELMLAYNQVREGRLKGLTPQQIVAQGDLTMTPERAAFVDAFYKADGKEQPTEVIAAQLIYTAQQAAAQRTDQASLFDERVAPADIARNAVNLIGRNETRADIGKDGQFLAARSTWPKPGGVQAWAVQQTWQRMSDAWDPENQPKVVIVQSAGDLPQNVLASLGPNINGATDLDRGTVYLVADNLKTMEDAERVIVHEVVGHYGFMRLWGDRWPKLVEDVIRLADQDGSIKRVRDDILRRYPKLERDHLAAEIVAHVAETRPKHPFAKRIIAAFRDILRRLGFKVNLSRTDLVYLIRRAADAMKDPRGSGYKGPRDRNITYRSPRVDRMGNTLASTGERDLIAQHNLSSENLNFVLGPAGGYLRVPSIAVTKAADPVEGFGEITLLGDAALIDPRGPNRAKVFGADIYSPRYPTVKRFLTRKELVGGMHDLFRLDVADDMDVAVQGYMDGDFNLEEAARHAGRNPGGLALLALEKGFTVKDIQNALIGADQKTAIVGSMSQKHMGRIESLVNLVGQRTGPIDFDGVIELSIQNARERIERLPFREKVFTGYDDQLGTPKYKPHTLENVIKEMKRNLRGGESDQINYGVGQIRAYVTPEFTSRKQISANKDRLDKIKFAFEKKRGEDLFADLAADMFGSSWVSPTPPLRGMQNTADFLVDVAKGGLEYAYRQLDKYGLNYTRDANLDARVKDFIALLRDMPTEYFEAKILGAVPLSDFKAAVVPNTLRPELKRALESRGIRLFEYAKDPGLIGDYVRQARQAAIERANREVESTLFASRPTQEFVEARGRRRAYSSGQLDLDFLAPAQQESLKALETRPDINPVQVDLGVWALRDLVTKADQNRGAKILYNAIKNFTGSGTNRLLGLPLNTVEDLGQIAQVYRDPRFETLRLILTKGGKVVHETAITSRLPTMVSFAGKGGREIHSEVLDLAVGMLDRKTADRVYLMHNHPSGNPMPSRADENATAMFAKYLTDKKHAQAFGGHVVIDRNRYSIIEARKQLSGDWATRTVEADLPNQPLTNEESLAIVQPSHIARYAKEKYSELREGLVMLFSASSRGELRAAATFPTTMLTDKRGVARIRRMMTETGGFRIFAAGFRPDIEAVDPLLEKGMIFDAVTFDEGGLLRSGSWYENAPPNMTRYGPREEITGNAGRANPTAIVQERLDQQGRPIPEGQQDLPGLDTGAQQEQQAPDFALEQQRAEPERRAQNLDLFGASQLANEPIRGQAPSAPGTYWTVVRDTKNGPAHVAGESFGKPNRWVRPAEMAQRFTSREAAEQVAAKGGDGYRVVEVAPTPTMPTRGQGRLFASRTEGPAGPTGMGFQGPPPGVTAAAAPPPGERGIDVGGGSYSMNQYGRLTDQEMNVLQSVMRDLEGRIEGERGGREPQTWDATERQALDMIRNQTGLVLDSLVNRKPGSTANAAQLEAYAQVIVKLNQQVAAVAQRIAATRNPTSEDLAELAQLRERLGVMIAPAMGYATEAGRSLNILRKVAGDLRTADDVLSQLGDGSENTLKDFAKRVVDAGGDINKVVGVTRASYTPTWWDKFYEYWINGILSGPTTHSVNIFSNMLFLALESATETVASVATAGQAVPMRSAMARVAAVPHGITLGLKNAATAWTEERAVLTPEDKLEGERHAIGGQLGRIVRIPGRALQAEDELFKAVAYQGTLSALAMDEAVRKNPQDPMAEHARIMGNILSRPDLIKRAKDHAARVTFTTPLGPIGQAVTNVLNRSKVGRLIVPFVRTPTNILKRALEYTPAAPAFAEVRQQLQAGGRDEAIAWSRMAVGSSIMLGVAALAAQGMMSGAGPDDEAERAQLMRQGWRPYSVKIPGLGWVKYNRFEPTGMLFGLAADMTELSGAMSAGEYDAIGSMLVTSLATNLGDKTFLRGITDFASAYSDPQRYMQQWAQGMMASPIPNVIGQTTRWLDPYQREARTMLDTIKSRIPGQSTQLAKRLDLAGDPIQRDSGAPGNPFQVSEPRQDALARTMLELGVTKNAVGRRLSIGGQSFELEGPDFESYKGYVQKARWNVLTPLVSSPQFQALKAQNPLGAQALLERQYDEIGRQARMAWIMRNPHVLTDPKKWQRSPTALGYELQ